MFNKYLSFCLFVLTNWICSDKCFLSPPDKIRGQTNFVHLFQFCQFVHLSGQMDKCTNFVILSGQMDKWTEFVFLSGQMDKCTNFVKFVFLFRQMDKCFFVWTNGQMSFCQFVRTNWHMYNYIFVWRNGQNDKSADPKNFWILSGNFIRLPLLWTFYSATVLCISTHASAFCGISFGIFLCAKGRDVFLSRSPYGKWGLRIFKILEWLGSLRANARGLC